MGLFGKSFEEKVAEAVKKIQDMGIGVSGLKASVDGKMVTLTGNAPSAEVKSRVMQEFNGMVETDNTINQVRVERPPAPVAPAPAVVTASPSILSGVTPTAQAATASTVRAEAEPGKPAERWHDVVSGDTLSKLAKRYYGDAKLYPRIFDANRNLLDNPDVIKVGQRLRVP